VILGSLAIDSGRTLTITKGCKVFVHGDAPVLVNGSLHVEGEKDSADRVYFRGDRLDDPYRSFPASWPGLYFSASSDDNLLTYAVISNAYQGIAAQGLSPFGPKIKMDECVIDNAYDAGIITLNSSITATNCLVSNCGKNLYLLQGGQYSFTHCTVASFSNTFILHRDPVLLVSDFVNVNNVPQVAPLSADFTNCIFWGENGTVDDEVIVARNGAAGFAVSFQADLWKIQKNDPSTVAGVTATQMINNQNPLFDSVNTLRNIYNFHLQPGSPAIDQGSAGAVSIDLDGNPRPVGPPDIGCYERQ
jgi:hypothetical protein